MGTSTLIEVFCRDRLGNILFQYAVGRTLAIRRNSRLRLHLLGREGIDDSNYGERVNRLLNQLQFFNLQAEISTADPHNCTQPVSLGDPAAKGKLFTETEWGFNPAVLSLPDGACLEGYFQNEKYFAEIAHLIRQELHVGENVLDAQSRSYLERIRESTSVAVHVRRGDYLNVEWLNICNGRYYTNAIEYLNVVLGKPRYFIFSDDIEWCFKNLNCEDCEYVNLSASNTNPVIDFKLMSLCNHQIIANSTFSWWPAWLNPYPDKIVVGPRHWFKKEAELAWNVSQNTLPASWIRIDN